MTWDVERRREEPHSLQMSATHCDSFPIPLRTDADEDGKCSCFANTLCAPLSLANGPDAPIPNDEDTVGRKGPNQYVLSRFSQHMTNEANR